MCRLYGFRSNTRRKVECELIRSQNSLLEQSLEDERGQSNPHGWGLATYELVEPRVVRQPEAAFDSDAFRWESARAYACNVLAHVRRATVGGVRMANTHPFTHGRWLLAHNGNLGAFDAVRPRLLAAMDPRHRAAIHGDTDSEHVFHWLLSLRETEPDGPLLDVVRGGVRQVIEWSEAEDPGAEIALNIILTDGEESVGLRYGRSLWYVERDLVHPCEVCDGALHVEEGGTSPYRAVVVASERVTGDEEWTQIPEAMLFHVDRAARFRTESL